jgi:hypothetical protein
MFATSPNYLWLQLYQLFEQATASLRTLPTHHFFVILSQLIYHKLLICILRFIFTLEQKLLHIKGFCEVVILHKVRFLEHVKVGILLSLIKFRRSGCI